MESYVEQFNQFSPFTEKEEDLPDTYTKPHEDEYWPCTDKLPPQDFQYKVYIEGTDEWIGTIFVNVFEYIEDPLPDFSDPCNEEPYCYYTAYSRTEHLGDYGFFDVAREAIEHRHVYYGKPENELPLW